MEDNTRKRMCVCVCVYVWLGHFAVQQKLTGQCKSTIIWRFFFFLKNLIAAAQVIAEAWVRSPAWHTGLNDMALLQLWLGFDSWPGNFHMSHCSHKKKFVFLWYSGLLFPWNFSCGSAVPFFLRFSLPLLRSCFLTPASAVHHSHTGVPREFHPNSSTGISPHPHLCGPISSQGFSNCL